MAIVLDGTTGITTPDLESAGIVTSNGLTTSLYPLVSGTAVASTSGTSIDFTGIPSWVKRVTVMFSGVSTNGTSNLLIQTGSGSFDTSGYIGSGSQITASGATTATSTAGYIIRTGSAANTISGVVRITLINSNTWVADGVLGFSDSAVTCTVAGSRTTSNTLDRVRITTVNGTDTFDAGSINILYE